MRVTANCHMPLLRHYFSILTVSSQQVLIGFWVTVTSHPNCMVPISVSLMGDRDIVYHVAMQ